jgi:hypothetical protein
VEHVHSVREYADVQGPVLSAIGDLSGSLWIVTGSTLARIAKDGVITQIAPLPQLRYPTSYALARSDSGRAFLVRREQRPNDLDMIFPAETAIASLDPAGALGSFTPFCVSTVPAFDCRNRPGSIDESLFVSRRDDAASGSYPAILEPAQSGIRENAPCFSVTQWRKPEVRLFVGAPVVRSEVVLKATLQSRVVFATGTCAVLYVRTGSRSGRAIMFAGYDSALTGKWTTVALDVARGNTKLSLGQLAQGYLAAIESERGRLSLIRFNPSGELVWRSVAMNGMPRNGLVTSVSGGFCLAGTSAKNTLAVACGN